MLGVKDMKKIVKLRDLECANCAAKMETGIRALPGVESAAVNFMAEKLTVEAPAEQMEAILAQAEKIIHRLEPDVRIQA